MRKFFREFKQFISRGNVMDMAVGVIIGGAFSAIVTALTNKIIMPVINWLLSLGGQNGLESARTILGEAVYNTAGDASSGINWASTIYIDWGAFITAIIDFLLIALVLFTILKAIMRAQGFIDKSNSAKPTKDEKKILKTIDVKGMLAWSNCSGKASKFLDSYDDVDDDDIDEYKETLEKSYESVCDHLKDYDKYSIKVKEIKEVEKEDKGLYKVKAKIEVKYKDDDDEREDTETMTFYVYKGKIVKGIY